MINFASVEDYIASFPPGTQKTLRKIRQVIRAAAPGADEAIRYGMPTFRLGGKNLIHFAAFAHHFGLYPTPGPIVEFAAELSPYESGKGSIRFPAGQPIPYALIKKIVTSRVKSIAGKK